MWTCMKSTFLENLHMYNLIYMYTYIWCTHVLDLHMYVLCTFIKYRQTLNHSMYSSPDKFKNVTQMILKRIANYMYDFLNDKSDGDI